jgi:hypothetical protein
MSTSVDQQSIGSLVDIALQIAEADTRILEQMKAAILAKDDQRAIGLAKQLCGIDDEPVH